MWKEVLREDLSCAPSSFFLVVIGHPLGHRRGSPVLPLSWGLLFVPISLLQGRQSLDSGLNRGGLKVVVRGREELLIKSDGCLRVMGTPMFVERTWGFRRVGTWTRAYLAEHLFRACAEITFCQLENDSTACPHCPSPPEAARGLPRSCTE